MNEEHIRPIVRAFYRRMPNLHFPDRETHVEMIRVDGANYWVNGERRRPAQFEAKFELRNAYDPPYLVWLEYDANGRRRFRISTPWWGQNVEMTYDSESDGHIRMEAFERIVGQYLTRDLVLCVFRYLQQIIGYLISLELRPRTRNMSMQYHAERDPKFIVTMQVLLGE